MSVLIMVTDSRGLATFITTGALPRDVEPKQASQLLGWVTRAEVFRPLLKLSKSPAEPEIWVSRKSVLKVQPFSVDRGDCLFEATGKLRFFKGARGGAAGNALMAFSNFPLNLQSGPNALTRKTGDGELNAGRTPGALAAGPIEWQIVAVNEIPPIGDPDQGIPVTVPAHKRLF